MEETQSYPWNTHGKDILKDVEEDLRLLIKRKLELYPDIKKQILNAHIQEVEGKHRITVASVRFSP